VAELVGQLRYSCHPSAVAALVLPARTTLHISCWGVLVAPGATVGVDVGSCNGC
jgi:hypothetical protein